MAQNKKQQAIIDELTRRVNMCRAFMDDWVLFNKIFNAYPTPGSNKAELEKQFLILKSKLARNHRVLKDVLQSDYRLDVDPMVVISGATSLEGIHSQSETSVKKLQNEWHRAFLSINEMLGMLEYKLERANAGESISLGPSVGGVQGGGGGGGGGMSPAAKKNIVIAILVLAGVGGVLYFFWDSYVSSFKSLFGG